MALKAIYATQDEIPEQFRELYTERAGKFELTGIEGIKTIADVTRLTDSLSVERAAHEKTKARLRPVTFAGKSVVEMNDDELRATVEKLDSFDELAARAGKVDDGAIEKIVESRVRTKLAPVERDKATLATELATYKEKVTAYEAEERRRTIHDSVREHAAKLLRPEAIENALVYGERMLEVGEERRVAARDGVGVTPGIAPDQWLNEMLTKFPHWGQDSQGGGARGSRQSGGVPNNPWSAKHWNLTEQGKYITQHGAEKADQAAKSAGSFVGATAPAKA